jgi:hypothetical protein
LHGGNFSVNPFLGLDRSKKRVYTSAVLKHLIYALLAALVFVASGDATVTVPMTLPQMADTADLIFAGKVKSTLTRPTPDGSYLYTYVTYEISKVLSGQYRDPTITLRFDGGTLSSADKDRLLKTLSPSNPSISQVQKMEMVDAPQFKAGEQILLFARGNTESEMPIVGFNQGSFKIVAGKVKDHWGNTAFRDDQGALVFMPPQGPVKKPGFTVSANEPEMESLRQKNLKKQASNDQAKLAQYRPLSVAEFQAQIMTAAKGAGKKQTKTADPKEPISRREVQIVRAPAAKPGEQPTEELVLVKTSQASFDAFQKAFTGGRFKVAAVPAGTTVVEAVRKLNPRALIFDAHNTASAKALIKQLRSSDQTRAIALVALVDKEAAGKDLVCRAGGADHFSLGGHH